MPTYISLVNFTQKGIENIALGPTRVDATREAYRALGGQLSHVFLTLGRYDLVVVGEMPDDTAVAKLALQTGRNGNVRTETLRAFTEAEYRDLVRTLK